MPTATHANNRGLCGPRPARRPNLGAALRKSVAPGALALTVLALGGCGGAQAPSGAYTAHIAPFAGKNGGFIAGDWTVTFKSGGSYTITTNHPTVTLGVGRGSRFAGTTFVINPQFPGSCGPGPGTGTYKLKLAGNAVRFEPITEPCRIRGFILARTFTKR